MSVCVAVSTALNEDALGQQYVGLVIGVLAAVILLLVVVIFVIIARNKRRKNTSPHNGLRENRVTINMKVCSHIDNLAVRIIICVPYKIKFDEKHITNHIIVDRK